MLLQQLDECELLFNVYRYIELKMSLDTWIQGVSYQLETNQTRVLKLKCVIENDKDFISFSTC